MTGVEMALLAAEELKGKEAARRIALELKSPMAILACTLDLVLTVKFMEKNGVLPKGLAEKAQLMAVEQLSKEGLV